MVLNSTQSFIIQTYGWEAAGKLIAAACRGEKIQSLFGKVTCITIRDMDMIARLLNEENGMVVHGKILKYLSYDAEHTQ